MDELERVLILRYGLEGGPPQTLEEVATKLGTTRERVRELEERAFCEPRLVVLRQGAVPQVTYVLIDPATEAAYYLGFDRLLVQAPVAEGEIVWADASPVRGSMLLLAGDPVFVAIEAYDRGDIQLAARYAAINLALLTAWLRANGAWWQRAVDDARLLADELASWAELFTPPTLEGSKIRELELEGIS